MTRQERSALKAAFGCPEPRDSAAFFHRHRRMEMSRRELILTQAAWVRPAAWTGSAAVLVLMLLLTGGWSDGTLWLASTAGPLMALLTVAERRRNVRWGMEELEKVCRLPVSTALLARMTALGGFQLLLLLLASPVLAARGHMGVVRAGVYLLTPYLLTAASGLEVSRHTGGVACIALCAAAAMLLTLAALRISAWAGTVQGRPVLPVWLAVLVLCAAATACELSLLGRKESRQWNWQ